MENINYFFKTLICLVVIQCSLHAQPKKEEWQIPADANKLENPLGNVQPNESTKALFQSTCMPCHGDKGKGDGPAGIALDPKPYNLTVKKVESETDGSIYYRITNGHLSMPNFESTLTEIQRWQMVIYIRHLQQLADEEKASKKSAKK